MHELFPDLPQAPMLDDILGQTSSTRDVLKHHTAVGYALLGQCAATLRACEGRVLISGMGASYFAAIPAAQAMEAQGRRVLLMESSELLHHGAGSYGRQDVAILISRSGGSVEVLRLAEQMIVAGVRVICVTNVPGSPLTTYAEHTLVLGSLPDQLIAVQTYTGTVLTLLLLAEQMAAGNAPALAHSAEGALPALQHLIEDSLAKSIDWKDFLLGARPIFLLARGSALAAAHAGALLFHETAKVPAVAMSSGQFRHGPVETVSPDFHAVVLGTPETTRKLDRKLAADLGSMGAAVLWVGPRDGTAPVPSMMEWPDAIPTLFQPVFAIIPLQVAAYRLAWWTVVVPGDFRYASEITADESSFPLFDTRRISS